MISRRLRERRTAARQAGLLRSGAGDPGRSVCFLLMSVAPVALPAAGLPRSGGPGLLSHSQAARTTGQGDKLPAVPGVPAWAEISADASDSDRAGSGPKALGENPPTRGKSRQRPATAPRASADLAPR